MTDEQLDRAEGLVERIEEATRQFATSVENLSYISQSIDGSANQMQYAARNIGEAAGTFSMAAGRIH